MGKRGKEVLIALIAIGAVVASLYSLFKSRGPKINLDPYQVLGVVAAEETATLLGNNGQVLVMIRDTGADKNPSVEAELSAFQQTLQKRPGLRLITERVQVTPLLMMATGGGVPADQMFKALETHRAIGALVLFFGFPTLGEAEIEALEKHKLKTIVISSFHPDYQRLLERRIIHLAIVPRPDPPPIGGPVPRTVRERFDQDYMIVRPEEQGIPDVDNDRVRREVLVQELRTSL